MFLTRRKPLSSGRLLWACLLPSCRIFGANCLNVSRKHQTSRRQASCRGGHTGLKETGKNRQRNRGKYPFPRTPGVPGRGLEPLRIAPPDPKSGASANFATPARLRKRALYGGSDGLQSQSLREGFCTMAEDLCLQGWVSGCSQASLLERLYDVVAPLCRPGGACRTRGNAGTREQFRLGDRPLIPQIPRCAAGLPCNMRRFRNPSATVGHDGSISSRPAKFGPNVSSV